MKNKELKISKEQFLVVLIFIVAYLWLGIYIPDAYKIGYGKEYVFIFLTMTIVICLHIYAVSRLNDYIFNPLSLVSIIWILTYHITPMINILTGETDLVGVDVMNGCYMGTLLSLACYALFIFGYLLGRVNRVKTEDNVFKKGTPESRKEVLVKGVIAFYFVFGILMALFNLVRNGFSLAYIFTLGTSGQRVDSENNLGFLSNFQYCLIPCTIYFAYYFKNKRMAIISLALTTILYMVNGFRLYLVVLFLSYFVFDYVYTIKKIKIRSVAIIIIVLLLMIGGVELYRSSMRQGNGIAGADWTQFDLMYVWKACRGNFNLYKTTYAIVEYIPKKMSFTWGQQTILTTLLTLIPRAIWPNKITAYLTSHSYLFIGTTAYNEAWALSSVCEFYGDFSAIGCVICFFIYGILFKKSINLYSSTRASFHTTTAYAVFYGFLFELIVRGYMPINFWVLVFMELPVLTIQFFKRKIV